MDEATATRLACPTLPKMYVDRPRLLKILDGADAQPLILVSSPAGTGKTSLVVDWVASSGRSEKTAWISLEESGDGPTFWPDVVEGLESLGVAVSSAPFASGGAVDRHLLTALCVAVASHPSQLTLVLDGCQVTSADVANDLDFLLRHTGHHLQLVIVTRVDPVLPLYRYRLEGNITEIRMADLAFSHEEGSSILVNSGVQLSAQSVRALIKRTKGWAAGLRFAAMFLAERDDPDAAVVDVAGDTGNIAEYLIAEVLDAQDPEIRELLLNTSIVDTLQPGLIEELGGPSAGRHLTFLSRANAFVDALIEHPGWYRYHPFFKEMLYAELAYESPERLVQLHRKAAEWFAREGLLTASIDHCAAIHEWAAAAGHVVDALAVGQLLLENGTGGLARTLKQMPSGVEDPAASLVRAALAFAARDFDVAVAELKRVGEDASQGTSADAGAVTLSHGVLQAVCAAEAGDPQDARRLVQTAQRLLAAREHSPRRGSHPELEALLCASEGIARLRAGELAEANDAFTAGAEAARWPGCESIAAKCLGFLALIAASQGHLASSKKLAARSIAAADIIHLPASDRCPTTEVALAWVAVEEYDLQSAIRHSKLAKQSRLHQENPVPRAMAAVVRSRLQRARGDLPGAVATVRRATTDIPSADRWLTDRLRVEAATLLVANGGVDVAALDSFEEFGGDAEIALVIAQAQLEQGDHEAAEASLRRVLVRDAHLKAQVTGWLLEVALELHRGHPGRARLALERSLHLAAPETLRLPFRQAPLVVQQFLARERELVAQTAWLTGPSPRSNAGGAKRRTRSAQDEQAPTLPIVEPLTAKELEVLGHLSDLLSTEEIARAMFVSVNTIRTHVRSILRKLAVSRRNEAVRRARQLSLIGAESRT